MLNSLQSVMKDADGRLGRVGGLAGRARNVWRRQSLARQFLMTSSLVMLVCMAAIGTWIAKKIEVGISQSTAAAAALYMDALVAPLAQDLVQSDRLSEDNAAKLDRLFRDEKLSEKIANVKIWMRNGVVAFSTNKDLIGQKFSPTPSLRKALVGIVSAEFEGLMHEDDAHERQLGMRLLEVYAPIREQNSGRIIAVSEFYIRADRMEQELSDARMQSWMLVGITTMLILAALAGFVSHASSTITAQKSSLERQVSQLETLLRENSDLGRRVQRAHARTGELNESYLRRVGADLHDGPAQLVGLALLQLDALMPRPAEVAAVCPRDFEIVQTALRDALKEIRELSAGLVLPELDELCVARVLHLVAQTYKSRTGAAVAVDISGTLPDMSKAFKICVYRFVQEALNNGWRHAGGVDQSVNVDCSDTSVTIRVSDRGKGFDRTAGTSNTTKGHEPKHLGLIGLRDRIEVLGGSLELSSTPGSGTCLTARFSLNDIDKDPLHG